MSNARSHTGFRQVGHALLVLRCLVMWELIVLGIVGFVAIVFVLAILIGGANLVADILEGWG